MTSPTAFQLDAVRSPLELIRGVTGLYPGTLRPGPARRRTYFDTFDGRLEARGALLFVNGTVDPLRLGWREDSQGPERSVDTVGPPDFADRLPAGPRESLGPLIAMRRLLPLVEIELEDATLDLLDGEAKTVARLSIEQGRARAPEHDAPWRPLPAVARVIPIRGYDDVFEQVTRSVAERTDLAAKEEEHHALALRVLGLPSPSRRGPARAPLPADVSAGDGCRQILLTCLDTIVLNEGGTRADLDTEFLHDLRVAVRRTRSLVTQLKGVLAPEVAAWARDEFRWMGQVTGPVRDLDVFLLDLDDLAEGLPAEDLEPLRQLLAAHRQEAQAALVAALDGPRYRDLCVRWRRLLDPRRQDVLGPDAERSLARLARRRIRRLNRRLVKHGRRIHRSTATARLHELRIDAKKLRYLLDACGDLGDVRPTIKELKRVQEILGALNDAAVQQAWLTDAARHLPVPAHGAARPLLALGRLLERLDERSHRARTRFAKRFRRFDSSDVQHRIEHLFTEGHGS